MPFDWWDESATVLRAPMATANGRTERDWSSATSATIHGCAFVRPRSGSDWADPARTRSLEWLLLAPTGSDVRAGDRVVRDGVTYEVDGVPTERRSPTGAVSHLRAELVAWGG